MKLLGFLLVAHRGGDRLIDRRTILSELRA